MAAAAILKIQKSRYLDNDLTEHHKIWHAEAVQLSWPFGPLQIYEIKKIKDGGGRHHENPKIAIYRQRFDRSAQHLAW